MLLAGTALVSALLATSLALSTPAAAVDQTITFIHTISLSEIKALLNNGKRNTTLGTTINNLALTPSTSEVNSNINSGNVGNLNQTVDGLESITSSNRISITNNGWIDPLIGIYGQINNAGISFQNSTVLSNLNGDGTTISLGDLNQIMDLDQKAALTNRISENNTGEITSSLFGIFAEINNTAFGELANSSVHNNLNGRGSLVFVGDLRQTMDVSQAAALSNIIDITNSGEIDPATGIFAGINNTTIGQLANSSVMSNLAGDGALLSVGDLLQTMEVGQSTTLANDISIQNTAPITASNVGIQAEIANIAVGQMANAIDNSNLNGDLAIVTLGDDLQSMDHDQSNAVDNSVVIDNDAAIDDPRTGLLAKITNQYLGQMFNDISALNANGTRAVVSAGDFTQSGDETQANSVNNAITIGNGGDIDSRLTGIQALITNSSIGTIGNSISFNNQSGDAAALGIGDFIQTGTFDQTNIFANNIRITNEVKIASSQVGIDAEIDNDDIQFSNSLDTSNNFAATSNVGDDLTQAVNATQASTLTNDIYISNSGNVRGDTTGVSAQILNTNLGFDNQATILNTIDGTIGDDITSTANLTQKNTIENTIQIVNTGKIWGGDLGIYASIPDFTPTTTNGANISIDNGTPKLSQSNKISNDIVIDNAGDIGADNLFAIDTVGASTTIYNRSGGVITGYVDLTDKDDTFFNQTGGSFGAREQSDFGAGDDLFSNSGIVHTADNPNKNEAVSFINLERFENSGVISLVDNHVGDTFTISNTVNGTDLDYTASTGSTLAVDAYLGGPGSKADHFIVQGNVSGKTLLQVNNTSSGGGALNREGIPIAFVDGTVKKDAFYLDKPIDAGFFDYSLFFVPTGSGYFELRSHAGGGSHLLPELVTLTHDAFQNTTDTWFDRSTDLRVLLAQGAACSSNPARPGQADRCQPLYSVTPGVWARGSGTWLNQQDSGVTHADGRAYSYNLDRDLGIGLFESGIDMGKRDLFSQGDILVLGVLGGGIEASLDYRAIDRSFNLGGGEVGAYATYLKGGLFVDTLFKTFFGQVDPKQVRGFPDALDNTTYGLRTDAGYRFGGMREGPFIEPLATIAASWSQVEDFKRDGNVVNLGDDSDVRGRLGLRLGTSSDIWNGTTFEPFVIGSLWGTLSDAHHAYLISNGRRYDFYDTPEDVWGVVSGGVNFFNPAAQTQVFAKVDYTFADQTQGVGVRAGMRYNW